jgi:hypothetical protein
MNIIEAVKSGKRMRRRAWCGSMYKFVEDWTLLVSTDVLADDWEVEEKKVTITESDFKAALVRTTRSFSLYDGPYICEYLSQLKKELGL